MREYVVVYAQTFSGPEKVLLILKDRPEWQRGRLNLPGGHVEQGETAAQCAVRELFEETGLHAVGYPETMGLIEGTNALIHVIRVAVHQDGEIRARTGETEKASWFMWSQAVNDPRLIPNLKAIIPLCAMRVRGWVLTDRGNEIGQGAYRVELEF